VASLRPSKVHFDYDCSANFGAYKTYQWVERRPLASGDELLDQDIKRAADEQLTGKGLRRVETGGDLQVSYQGAISQKKSLTPSALDRVGGATDASSLPPSRLARSSLS
jgi:hypothetical protein